MPAAASAWISFAERAGREESSVCPVITEDKFKFRDGNIKEDFFAARIYRREEEVEVRRIFDFFDMN
jgi:hypothetical protein